MKRIAIVEDDLYTLKVIVNIVENIISNYTNYSLDYYENAQDFITEIKSGKEYCILLLDIELGDPGTNGIELAKSLLKKDINVYIVFITAHPEFALESYTLDAYQYILKDTMQQRLPIILNKIITRINYDMDQFYILKRDDAIEKVYYKNIIYLMKAKAAKYTRFVTQNGEYKERISLEMAMEKIGNANFIKVERGCIVNIKHINKIAGNVIYMSNGDFIPISRNNLARVKKEIIAKWENNDGCF